MLLSVVRAGWRHPDRGTPIPVLPTWSSHFRPRGTSRCRLETAAPANAASGRVGGMSLKPDVPVLLMLDDSFP